MHKFGSSSDNNNGTANEKQTANVMQSESNLQVSSTQLAAVSQMKFLERETEHNSGKGYTICFTFVRKIERYISLFCHVNNLALLWSMPCYESRRVGQQLIENCLVVDYTRF